MRNTSKRTVVKAVLSLGLLGMLFVTSIFGTPFRAYYVWLRSEDSSQCFPDDTGLICAEWFSEFGLESVCCIEETSLGSGDPDACVTLLEGGWPLAPRDNIP